MAVIVLQCLCQLIICAMVSIELPTCDTVILLSYKLSSHIEESNVFQSAIGLWMCHVETE